jgi:hypothetical protein
VLAAPRAWWPLAVLCAFALLVRAQTFGNPVLGYDEQFYLLVGDRMLHGAVPYIDIWDRKPIGLFSIYAAIRAVGGDGIIQYQLAACGCVIATAWLIQRAGERLSDRFGGLIAACLYILWLNFVEGEGGQAPVFYNLPVALAAMIVWRATTTRCRIMASGAAAMVLVGLAIQIKYTVVFEGAFFGCVLLWTRYQATRSFSALWVPALLWVGLALAPTALVAAWYAHIGALQPFVFANFLSQFGRPRSPMIPQAIGFLTICGIMLPLLVPLWLGRRHWPVGARFFVAWLAAAFAGMIALGSFLSPHYLQPVLVPLTILSAPFFAHVRHRRRVAVATLVVFLLIGQIVLFAIYAGKGGRREALLVAAAARPAHGCIYVYDGFPALYMLTHSCLPTRFAFPGMLNTASEASVRAIGVDPSAEERRILATRPEVIVDYFPAYTLGNKATHAILEDVLARDYRLAYRLVTGAGGQRLVYRLKDRRRQSTR